MGAGLLTDQALTPANPRQSGAPAGVTNLHTAAQALFELAARNAALKDTPVKLAGTIISQSEQIKALGKEVTMASEIVGAPPGGLNHKP